MSLRYKIIFAILFSACVTAVLVAAPLFQGTRDLAHEGSDRELKLIQDRVNAALDGRMEIALAMTRLISEMPRVQEAMRANDDYTLESLFSENFSQLSETTGITEFQFHSADVVSVMRVHDPFNSGDDLSKTRPIVVAANEQKKPLLGLERSDQGVWLRGISPIQTFVSHVGSIEMGIPLDQQLMETVLSGTGSSMEIYLPLPSQITLETDVSQLERLSTVNDGPALLDARQLGAVLAGDPIETSLEIDGVEMAGSAFVINDFAGNPVIIAHILLPQSHYVAIQGDMLQLALGATFVALTISAILAWAFGKRLTSALSALIGRLKLLAQGDTDLEFDDLLSSKGEIREMAQGLMVFRDGLVEADQLKKSQERHQADQEIVVTCLADALKQMANGQLDTRIDDELSEGYEQLSADYNTAAANLSSLIADIAGSSDSIREISQSIGKSASALSSKSETTAATLEQTSAALQQVTDAVSSSAEGANSANEAGQRTIEKAMQGAEIVSDTVNAMTEINNSSDEIARITAIIDDIAFQTNLLALNAGVEAARAGSSGSGFAVVAAEVQALAQRTAEAAGQIGGLITTSGERVQHGVSLVGKTGAALDDILSSVKAVTEQVSKIASLTQSQADGLREVNVAVRHLDTATQENAGLFQTTTDASEALSTEGTLLQHLVGRFTHSDEVALNDVPQEAKQAT